MLHKIFLVVSLPLFLLVVGCSLTDGEATIGGSTVVPNDTGSESETGTIIITVDTEPSGQAGSFLFTGVPSGTITVDNTLVVSDLDPGTYTTTEVNPAPNFDVTAVRCDDQERGLASSGDAQTRTAVINLDVGETVNCTFTNTQRATAVVVSETEPAGAAGQVLFTGVPSGTISVANGTLVVANLPPGTYTTTEADPAPQFDLTAVSCDDNGSATVSGGDPSTRSAIFQLDPGEMVTCMFVNTRRATAVIAVITEPSDSTGEFTFTGVPSGTLPTGGSLVVTELSPGTYTSTAVDPAPDFELTEVTCDDQAGELASSGDAATRSAIFNLDPGETVTCTYLFETNAQPIGPGGGGSNGGDGDDSDGGNSGGINPFTDPDPRLPEFPIPEELPPGAGTFLAPRPGPWLATNLSGQLDCGVTVLNIPPSPPEGGTLDVQDGGATVIASGVAAETESITLTREPVINGRYAGSFQGVAEGVPITIDYFWQLVTDEYIIGYLTSSYTAEGITCTIYRPFELRFNG